MKKNTMMRLASILLVCVLLTTSVISGTFAKYTTGVQSSDTARVAYWGFDKSATVEFNLFKSDTTETGLENIDGVKLLAPGTKGSASFAWVNAKGDDAPEVDYTVTIDLLDTTESIGALDAEIVWKLDGNKVGENGSWAELKAALLALCGEADGSATYEAGTAVPAALRNGVTHTIAWEWAFDGDADADTALGNASDLQDVKLAIKITVEQAN